MAKELSVFIDESGDFGGYAPHSPYYIIGLVFHEQSKDIFEPISYLDRCLGELGFKGDFVHMGPLIRKEDDYELLLPEERVRILRKMLAFVRKIDFSYKIIMVQKRQIVDEVVLYEKLAKQLSDFIKQHLIYFYSFDKVKIYYDNGQAEIMKIIISVFTSLISNAEFRKAAQKDEDLILGHNFVALGKTCEHVFRSSLLVGNCSRWRT